MFALGRWDVSAPLAHGLGDPSALPVPPSLLVGVGAALLVAVALWCDRRTESAAEVAPLPPWRPGGVAWRTVGVAVALAVTVAAAFGPTDAARNPAATLLYSAAWGGLLLVSTLLAPVGRAVSPLRAAGTAVAAPGPRHPPGGLWTAVAALSVFALFDAALPREAVLVLLFVVGYAAAQLAGVLRWGPEWLARADIFEVASETLGTMSPWGASTGGVRWRGFRSGLVGAQVAAGTSAVLGGLLGADLADAAGLPAGILAASGALLLWLVGGVAAVELLARPADLLPAVTPAVAAHVVAHYLGALLVDVQVAAVLLSDPLGRGWNVLGLTGAEIVAEPVPPAAGLMAQAAILVAGHALAVAVASELTLRRHPGRPAGAVQLPIRMLIGASLVAGLWLRVAGGGM